MLTSGAAPRVRPWQLLSLQSLLLTGIKSDDFRTELVGSSHRHRAHSTHSMCTVSPPGHAATQTSVVEGRGVWDRDSTSFLAKTSQGRNQAYLMRPG